MKLLIFVIISTSILQAICLNIQSKNEILLDEDEQACIIETEVSEELVLESKSTSTVPANDAKYKNFLSCLWKRYGYQKPDGEMDWEKIREVLRETYSKIVVGKLIEKCDDIRGITEGDTAALVLRCLDDHAPSLRVLHSYYAGHNT